MEQEVDILKQSFLKKSRDRLLLGNQMNSSCRELYKICMPQAAVLHFKIHMGAVVEVHIKTWYTYISLISQFALCRLAFTTPTSAPSSSLALALAMSAAS